MSINLSSSSDPLQSLFEAIKGNNSTLCNSIIDSQKDILLLKDKVCAFLSVHINFLAVILTFRFRIGELF